ncbi:hypothetical protein NDU88_005290 [Pleurodeles waltl]|uniref:Uncharacterized protein n=1 Tax=Pleurodeles waltl TaxID=8319 RepID=A0AAV7WUC2_PLEWA|nr:hypothetical protein NDU88_005290 [Pleurodeles waltl]
MQVLRMLQEESREDLLQEGVLQQAWVGLKRPNRASSEGVAAVVIACESPTRKSKKFRQKSVAGRKIVASPDSIVVIQGREGGGLPGHNQAGRRGETKFVRRCDASIRQRVCAKRRGINQHGVVTSVGHLVAAVLSAHERVATRVSAEIRKQALLPLEKNCRRVEGAFEERQCGAASKMAAPTTAHQQEVIELSDGEEVDSSGESCFISGVEFVNVPVLRQDGGRLQLVPRLFSPMLHKDQEWDVSNQTIYQSGQHMEVMEKGGMSMRLMLVVRLVGHR